jgi:hypothetical protein
MFGTSRRNTVAVDRNHARARHQDELEHNQQRQQQHRPVHALLQHRHHQQQWQRHDEVDEWERDRDDRDHRRGEARLEQQVALVEQ